MSKNKERESRIKDLTFKLKTPSGLTDLEDEPAYKRRNVMLDNVPHSSESQASRYTLSEDENADGTKETKLKDNNSFLHDNVD
jgi:cell division protein FtsZ